MDCYVEALDLWTGPAGAGMGDGLAASSIFSDLNAEFLDASAAAGALAVQLKQPERVLSPLTLAVAIDPLNEPVVASLVTALGAAGRQADALSRFYEARARLADDLGIDPGPALVAAHRRVLEQSRPTQIAADSLARREPPLTPPGGMVGRVDEFSVLSSALESALTGASGLVVVEGEPGIGKTRLLREVDAVAARSGAVVAWGRCRDREGTPTLWPWVEIIETLLSADRSEFRQRWVTGELGHLIEPNDQDLTSPVLPDIGARFRLFEQVVSLIGHVARRRPVLILVDDLQWADLATLELFEHLASRLPSCTALVGAARDHGPAPGMDLVRTLAAVSRDPRHRRLRLDALRPADVAELVLREDGITLRPAAARSIHARTSGNPFFVRELSKLLAEGAEVSDEAAERAGIPATILDVVRDRTASLDDRTRRRLEVAAVLGSEVDLTVLANVLNLDQHSSLEQIEIAQELGLVMLAPDSPYLLRFRHDVVRGAIVESIPRPELATTHLQVADALERVRTADDVAVEQLAHHLWEAGTLAEPARTAEALICAGRAAAAKSALDVADQHLRSAASLARVTRLPQIELTALTQLTAVVGMRSGYVGSALDSLERAEHLARTLGREREAADLLFSRWAAYSQGIELDQAERLARRLRRNAEGSRDPLIRAYGWNAWGFHQWDVGNVGEAYRYVSRVDSRLVEGGTSGDEAQLRRDLQLLWPVMRALMTALHGDVEEARALLDALEVDADDDPYAITVWAAFSVVIAALAGDAEWAERAAKRGIAVDPHWTFAFLGAYHRLALCWARGVSGDNPSEAAADAERIIQAVLVNPPRSGLATWYGLLAEIFLVAGKPAEATMALNRADDFLVRYGQRYAEGFLLLLRARAMNAERTDPAVVLAVAERARALSVVRGAHLFARRAEALLADLTSRH